MADRHDDSYRSSVAFVTHTRDYRSSDVLPALARHGFTTTERPHDRETERLITQFDPDLVVLAIDPRQDEDLALIRAVSRASTALTKSMFPRKLHGCTDPMTGFFLVDRDALDLDALRPRGFKILLEILARRQLRIGEVPFAFATRYAGESKATFTQGIRFLTQLAMLRFGRMSAFALVGGLHHRPEVEGQPRRPWRTATTSCSVLPRERINTSRW